MKEFIVKDSNNFALRVTINKCLQPKDLNWLEFIQESKNNEGEVISTSKYQFFLTNNELKHLTNNLNND